MVRGYRWCGARSPAVLEVRDHDLLHLHELLIRPRALHQLIQVIRHDLPSQAELVLQPTALLGIWVCGEAIPIAIQLVLAMGIDQQRNPALCA